MKISKTREKQRPSPPRKKIPSTPKTTKPIIPTPVSEPIITTIFDFSPIEKILYINLASRKDRREEMEAQFEKLGIPPEKIQRIEAVEDFFGAIGCTRSHIKAIQMAQQQGLKNVLILEDDFNFTVEFLHENLEELKRINFLWDVIMFSGNLLRHTTHSPVFFKVLKAYTSAGYLVNGSYYQTLLENYQQGLQKLIETRIHRRYAIDIWFSHLQSRDKWYIFAKKAGYQRCSYSDIEKRIVSYGC